MRKVLLFVLLSAIGLMSACGPVSSLTPLFTDKETVFDSNLLGDWAEEGSGDFTLRFEKDGSNAYRIVDTEFDEKGGTPTQTVYRARLVNLDGHRFLDVVPDNVGVQAGSYGISLPQQRSGSDSQSQVSKLGDGVYAEVVQDPENTSEGGGLAMAVKQAHWIFEIKSDGGTIRLASLDEDWMKHRIDQGLLTISHVTTNDSEHEVVLTAETRELQQFVAEHADDPEAFPHFDELHRMN